MKVNTFGLLLCIVLYNGYCNAAKDCSTVTCPASNIEESCRDQKAILHLPDPLNECCNKTECICVGTTNRLSTSTNLCDRLIKRYANCTIVDGNLEIVSVREDRDCQANLLNALKDIKEVTGYVLISINTVPVISLPNLRLIRGNDLYTEMTSTQDVCNSKPAAAPNAKKYSLVIVGNQEEKAGLKEIHMPVLTEILTGDIKITLNSYLCYVDTILWHEEIVKNMASQKVEISENGVLGTCQRCHSDCNNHCWGPASNLCQQFSRVNCTFKCPNRCTKNSCCSDACAAGCMDIDISQSDRSCYACLGLNNNGSCKTDCDKEFTKDANDVPKRTENSRPFALSRYCVAKCPNTRRTLGMLCVATCPIDYYDKDGICEPCETDREACNKICYGLGPQGPLQYDSDINANNIGNFTKNCTIIEGSLVFREALFKGDPHCHVPKLNSTSMLNVFENVREITGYLSIDHWKDKDLCIFKNLKTIRGNEIYDSKYSLMVSTHGTELREMCFNSLQEIISGHIYVGDNKFLCHVKTVNFKELVSDKNEQLYRTRKNGRKGCSPCHVNCLERDGCWGPGSEQCVTCKNFTDYTNDNGEFSSPWVIDKSTNLNVPGYNTTRCVTNCDKSKGVYATDDKKCFPCHPECIYCSGPADTHCTVNSSDAIHGCKNFHLPILGGKCVPTCPLEYYTDSNNVCQSCSSNCLSSVKGEENICKGPADELSENGCTFCFFVNDTQLQIKKFMGTQCSICLDCPEGCSVKYGDSDDKFECLAISNAISTVVIIIISVVVVALLIVIFLLYRHRKTIRKMRKHIGDNMLAEREPLEDLNSPLTPSGTAPNQAQLRIVKESELNMGKELGSGAFGAVYKALWTPLHIDNEKVKIAVAVKTLKTISHSNEIMDEAYVMASVDSPYLVRLLGICMASQVSLITQLMPLGSLLEYVKDNTDTIGSRDMLSWCVQIAKGMLYLEEKHLVHRDLAARNVLLKTPRHAKITDFGLAKLLSADQHEYFAEGGKLPIKWLALECITERKFSHQSDVWAYGVTCWEIFTFGMKPYEGVRAVEVFSLLERGDRLPQPQICTIDVYMLLIKCWMVDPLSRPRFSELVDEFAKMSHDPVRYLVIEADPTINTEVIMGDDGGNIISPRPIDEAKFFRKLLEEDELAGDGFVAEDPDEYLLSNEDTYTYMSSKSNSSDHEYANQEAMIRAQRNSVKSNRAGPSGQPRAERLFSRNTPSANAIGMRLSNSGRDPPLSRTTSRVSGNSSNPDDVFANEGHPQLTGTKSLTVDIPEDPDEETRPNACWNGHGDRKDSETRYTEDPTFRKNPSHDDHQLQYDDEEYLLPTQGQQKPAYFDPAGTSRDEEDTLLGQPGNSLSNSTYVDSPHSSRQLSRTSSDAPGNYKLNYKTSNLSNMSRKPLLGSPTSPDAEYVNTMNGHEYMNTEGLAQHSYMPSSSSPQRRYQDEHFDNSPKQDPNFFINEEYMATDSGIGEETQNHQQKRNHRDMSSLSSAEGSSSNGSGNALLSNSPIHTSSTKTDTHGYVNANGKTKPNIKSPTSNDSNILLDNPEYMMLHNSTNV